MSIEANAGLEESDVRAMIRLVGDVAALQKDHAVKKAFLMQGICDLIGADKWAWALVCDMAADRPPVAVSFMHGGFTEEQFVQFLMALEHPDTRRTNATLIEQYRVEPKHITRLREQIDPKNIAVSGESRVLWEGAGIGPVIMSIRPMREMAQSSIGFYRELSRPPFSPRESRIAHIVLSEIGWLHEQGWPGDHATTAPQLSPRQRITLNLLLEGQSRKEISHHLGISINTVAGYVKEVFRHFGVQSHAALMRRFQEGDGGDVTRQRGRMIHRAVQFIVFSLLPNFWPDLDVDAFFG